MNALILIKTFDLLLFYKFKFNIIVYFVRSVNFLEYYSDYTTIKEVKIF